MNKCQLCKSDNVYNIPLHKDDVKNLKGIIRCKACGGLCPTHPMTLNGSKNYLHDSVYEYKKFTLEDFQQFVNKDYYVCRLIRSAGKKGLALDMGAHIGGFIYNLNKIGFIAYGLEALVSAVVFSKKININIFSGLKIQDLPDHIKCNKFHLISFMESFYYFQDPIETLTEVRKLLDKDGILLIQTINGDSQYFHKNSFSGRYGSNVQFIPTHDSMLYLLRSLNYEIVKVEVLPRRIINRFLKVDSYFKFITRPIGLFLNYLDFWNRNQIKYGDKIIVVAKKMNKDFDRLALIGGNPVRTKPFKSNVIIGKRERDLVNRVLDSKEFSRFMGGADENIEELLVEKSIDTENISDRYFSFLGGKMVRKFESDFSSMFSVDYSVSVNSATSALSAAVGACGVEPEDEVITTVLSFTATATSILLFNAIPVFVDVENETYNIDCSKIEEKITPKTKAILVVHLLGEPVDMDMILKIAKKHNLYVIEDACQAPGVSYKGKLVGTIGDIGIFSFNEPKNIQTGEGGMIVTNQEHLAKKCRLIRNHGEGIAEDDWTDSDLINIIGHNFRMTELTAALGVAQLTRLKKLNEVRVSNSKYLEEELSNIENLIMPNFSNTSVPHCFPIRYIGKKVSRNKIIKAISAEGIMVGKGYSKPMHLNQMFVRKIAYGSDNYPWTRSKITYCKGDFPVAESLVDDEFIWIYQIAAPNTIDDMKDIVKAFNKVFSNLDVVDSVILSEELRYKW
jgi:perosamine synthetase